MYPESRYGDVMVKLSMKAASQQYRRCWAALKMHRRNWSFIGIYVCWKTDTALISFFSWETSQGLDREIINPLHFTWYWRSDRLCSNHKIDRGKNQTRNRTSCLCPWKNFHSRVLNKRPSNFLEKPLFSRCFLIFPALSWMKELKFKGRCGLNLFLKSLSLMSTVKKLQQKVTKTFILSTCPLSSDTLLKIRDK